MKEELKKYLDYKFQTKEEKIQWLEDSRFLLQMKDHWTHTDFEEDEIYTQLIDEYKEKK